MDANKLTVDDLKTAYKVVTKIMKENNLMKDNSFTELSSERYNIFSVVYE